MIPESEKVAYYSLADVFVMPRRGEGFGIVYLEAMACGIPTVASRLDRGREGLRNGMLGILVNPGDLEDVKQGILDALKLPKGRSDGLDYFSFPRTRASPLRNSRSRTWRNHLIEAMEKSSL